jgi:adenosylcobinamide-GDP ribazoletransferase
LSAHRENTTARSQTTRRAWRGLAGAVAFLTIMPVPAGALERDRLDLTYSVPWFPVVGSAVGALAGCVRLAGDPLFGRGPSTVMAMIVLVVVTGALHQDGLADTGDGLGVRGDRTRRLAVMRDSRIGTLGVLALILWALLLFTSLQGLTAGKALGALITAGAAGRLAALLHRIAAQPARRDGLGAGLRVTPIALAIAIALAAPVAVVAGGPARGGLSLAVCALVSGVSAVLARRAVGGSTGDTLGATVAVTEVSVCLALMASWR